MQNLNEKPFQKRIFAAPDRILVATDLTDTDFLVPHVIAQAKASGARVTLIHAVGPSDSLPIEPAAIACFDELRIDREVRSTLRGIFRQIESHGIVCDVAVRHGYAADVILEEINRTQAARLIMGTHGRGKFAQIALGSVVKQLLRTVDIPIFAVGPHTRASAEHITPRKILHPVSLVGNYPESVCFAIDLAQSYRAELILLHVLGPDTGKSINPGRTLDWARNAMSALLPNADDLVPPVRSISTYGNLVEEILSNAISTKADWIVLGVNGKFPLSPFQETTAYKVLAAAKCPVLILRHQPNRVEWTTRTETRFAGVIG
ncbi:MAG: universal stress protein [Silvibacterium sp.]